MGLTGRDLFPDSDHKPSTHAAHTSQNVVLRSVKAFNQGNTRMYTCEVLAQHGFFPLLSAFQRAQITQIP